MAFGDITNTIGGGGGRVLAICVDAAQLSNCSAVFFFFKNIRFLTVLIGCVCFYINHCKVIWTAKHSKFYPALRTALYGLQKLFYKH